MHSPRSLSGIVGESQEKSASVLLLEEMDEILKIYKIDLKEEKEHWLALII